MYHTVCWADAKKKATPKSEWSVNFFRTLAVIEFTNIVESFLNDFSGRVLECMNVLYELYYYMNAWIDE